MLSHLEALVLARSGRMQEARRASGRAVDIDHRSILLVDPLGAIVRLQLARALVLSRDTAKAKSVYSDFLTLWTDADANIPIVNEARTEYAKTPVTAG